MTTEYGIEFNGNLIRKGFSEDQAASFMKAKEYDSNYKIVKRTTTDWERSN